MTTNQLIVGVFSLVLFAACAGKEQNHSRANQYAFQLHAEDTLLLPIDERTSLYNPILQYWESGGKNYLLVSNRTGGGLDGFDLNEKKKSFSIRFERDGPNGIGGYKDARVLRMDSIMVLSSNLYNGFYVADSSGVLQAKHVLQPKAEESERPIFFSITNMLHLSSGKLFFFDTPAGIGQANHAEVIRKSNTVVCYDLDSKEWDLLPIKFPELYAKGRYAAITYWGDLEAVENNVIVNFPAADELYVYNINNHSLTPHKATADEASPIRPFGTKAEESVNQMDAITLETPAYLFLLYDTFRKVYYRFYLDRQTDLSSVGDILKMYDQKPCTIVVLDSTFTKIAEVKLPLKTYHVPDHFVAREGLYLSLNNPDNRLVKEDQLAYQLFKLTPIVKP